jgi:hypothetical protein
MPLSRLLVALTEHRDLLMALGQLEKHCDIKEIRNILTGQPVPMSNISCGGSVSLKKSRAVRGAKLAMKWRPRSMALSLAREKSQK